MDKSILMQNKQVSANPLNSDQELLWACGGIEPEYLPEGTNQQSSSSEKSAQEENTIHRQ